MDGRQELHITNLLRDLRSSEVSDRKPRSFRLPSSSDDSNDEHWPEAGNSGSRRGKNEASGYDGRIPDLKGPRPGCSASFDRDYSGHSRVCPDISDGAFSDGRHAGTSSRTSDSRGCYFSGTAGGRGPLGGERGGGRGGGGRRGGGQGEEENSSESDGSIEESAVVEDRLRLEQLDVECEDEGKEFEEETEKKLIDFGDEEKEIADFVFEFHKDEKGKAFAAKRKI